MNKRRCIVKRLLSGVLGLSCAFGIFAGGAAEVSAAEYWPEVTATESPSVILMEQSTGTILYEKDSQTANYPASITKIMTTLIALENSSLDEVVTFSDEAIDNTEGSGIARDYGEQMTMEQCLYGVMLESANECAYAVAEHVGGTMENFVDMMNAKAQELGCVNTHFANPHGLTDPNHYTCAYDMALIAKAAYDNETFRIITGTKTYTIPPTNKHTEETILRNHNNMLTPYNTTKYVYEYCVGGKTGYTDAANSTLVTYAQKDGMTLICVVMNTVSPAQWTDSINLFDWGFSNFQLFNVADNETNYTSGADSLEGDFAESKPFVEIDSDANIVLPTTAQFSDAESTVTTNDNVGGVVGTIDYTYAGKNVGSADIVQTDIQIEGYVFDNEDSGSEEEEKVHIRPMTIVLVLLGLVVLAFLGLLIKKYVDNFYIMRHNREVKRQQKAQLKYRKEITKRHKRRRKRW